MKFTNFLNPCINIWIILIITIVFEIVSHSLFYSTLILGLTAFKILDLLLDITLHFHCKIKDYYAK